MFLLLLLAACEEPAPPPAPQIKDVFRPILVVNTGNTREKGEFIQVFLHPEQDVGCTAIPDLHAEVDGVPLTRLHGKAKSGEREYDRDCNVFEFTAAGPELAALAAKPSSKVTVSDGSSVVSATWNDLFAPRVLTPVKAKVKRGEAVELTWSPGRDTLMQKTAFSVLLTGGGKERYLDGSALEVTPGHVRFTVPPDLDKAFTGPVTLTFRGTLGLQPTRTACEWAIDCQVSRVYTVPDVSLEVER